MCLLAGNSIYENGSIMYQGRDLMQLPEEMFHEIRGTKISMIFQDPMSSLNPIIPVGKQIAEALIFKLGMPKEIAKKKAIELMEQVGIAQAEKRYNQYPFQFSGGMRQRIVISIALANNAEILICDEPTTALDVTIQGQILELINNLKKEKNLSVIFITHDLGVVANIATRIAVMYAGKIVEIGKAEEVFYNPQHPYTWALLSSMPNLATSKHLDAIAGTPPNMIHNVVGDAFAPRNKYAMAIDFEEEPPFFKVSDTHYAATWLLHPDAPKVELPEAVKVLKQNRGKIIG
jgi:oligopeptide transport system ATP-binding protein